MAMYTEVRTSKTHTMKSIAILISAACITLASTSTLAKGVFKYEVDGVVMYGDRVPTGATTEGHSVLSARGSVLREVVKDAQGEVIPPEAEADREKRKQLDITEADLALLEKYNSDEELIEEGDKAVYALDNVIYRYERRIEVLKKRASQVSQKMQAIEEARGRGAAGQMRAELKSLQRNIADAQAAYDTKSQERFTVNAKVNADLARYRELTYVPESQQAELDE